MRRRTPKRFGTLSRTKQKYQTRDPTLWSAATNRSFGIFGIFGTTCQSTKAAMRRRTPKRFGTLSRTKQKYQSGDLSPHPEAHFAEKR
jgi:uncharacterized protein YifE (UPF0438 family)